MMITLHNRRRGEAGYNLVEVLIATALTGTVILSIMTLFFMGRSNVYAGKQMTRAVSVGTRVLEDLSPMTATDVFNNLLLTDGAVAASNTFNGKTYTNSIVLTITPTTTYTATNDPQNYFRNWQALIQQASFNQAQIQMLIVPKQLNPTTSTNKLTDAEFILIRTNVQWREANRVRNMVFDTTKVNRQ